MRLNGIISGLSGFHNPEITLYDKLFFRPTLFYHKRYTKQTLNITDPHA